MQRSTFVTGRGALFSAAALLSLGLFGAGCQKEQQPAPAAPAPAAAPVPAAPTSIDADDPRLSLFKPALPADYAAAANPASEDRITLGRMLYFETRLSKNHDVSCNSCHDLASYGVDGKKVSNGHKKQTGTRNSPTVYNAAGHFVQFWDGRAKDVEEQAQGPVLNPVEMAMPAPDRVEATLRSIPKYVELFQKAFPGDKQPVTFQNMAMAIGAFERRLLTPARWDKFLAGDKTALSAEEKAGLAKFVETGCTACHLGTLLGGGMFQKAGLVKPWPSQADKGRAAVTKRDADELFFKVPSLRNIEKTGPYFHDGSVDKLDDAVRIMARHQLGKELSDADVGSIVTFLRALTGTVPADYIKAPQLPPSGPKTPKPDPA
jgi:cytochrome c peroxidase